MQESYPNQFPQKTLMVFTEKGGLVFKDEAYDLVSLAENGMLYLTGKSRHDITVFLCAIKETLVSHYSFCHNHEKE